MITPELISFIKKELGSGKKDVEVKTELLTAGWKTEDVEEGFKSLNLYSLEISPPEILNFRKIKRRLSIFLILDLSLVILFFVIPIVVLIGSRAFIEATSFFGILLILILLDKFIIIISALIFFLNIFIFIKSIQAKNALSNFSEKIEIQVIKKAKRKVLILIFLSAIFIILCIVGVFIPSFITKDKRIEKSTTSQVQSNFDEAEGRIVENLKYFKTNYEKNSMAVFNKISQLPNNGNCKYPTMGSVFDPNRDLMAPWCLFSFTDRLQPGCDEPEAGFQRLASQIGWPEYAQCYSDSENYAVSLTNEYSSSLEKHLDDFEPKYYCIDNKTSEVKFNTKPIKGPSCDDLDLSILNKEGVRIKIKLLDFKKSIEGNQKHFIGYGKVENLGSCIDPIEGSLFNPGEIFKPKTIVDKNSWYQARAASDIRELQHFYRDNAYDGWVFNNMSDTRCFSSEEHYAYQVPNFQEDPYPTFYCVDDIHPEVMIGSKQIKGSNCTDFNESYLPPENRPIPDRKGAISK